MHDKSKRLLFVTTRLFWPADSGRKVVLWNYCKGLAEQLGYEVHLYSFLEGGQSHTLISEAPSFISKVELAVPLSAFEKTAGLLKAMIGLNQDPFQCALYVSKRNIVKLREYCKQFNPDVIIVDMVRLAPYLDALEDCNAVRIIDFDDLLSKRYERQSTLCDSGSNVLGKYSESAGSLFKSLMRSPLIKKNVLKLEARRVAAAEIKYGERYDASVLISDIEANEFSRKVEPLSVFTATMGALAYPYVSEEKRVIKYDCCFIGNMGSAANQDSLRFIVDEILSKMKGASLRVIGSCPNCIAVHYANDKRISFSGRVDSIRSAALECKIMLAPLAYGTGIKTKILEALGFGLPVVTNSIGAEGIDLQNGVTCICVDDADDIASKAMELLQDRQQRDSYAVEGIKFINSKHSWEKSISCLGDCISYCKRKRA